MGTTWSRCSTACTTWAIQSERRGTSARLWPRTAPGSSSNRSQATLSSPISTPAAPVTPSAWRATATPGQCSPRSSASAPKPAGSLHSCKKRRAVAKPSAFSTLRGLAMSITETGTRARLPDSSGYAITPDGLRLYYEVFGRGDRAIVFLPANRISHSRLWKAQIHYLARHFRVVAYDGRGNGLSDFPDPATLWSNRFYAADCLSVMDVTATRAAILVGICTDGVFPSIQLAASHPERVLGIVAIAPGVPHLTPRHPNRAKAVAVYEQVLDSNEGWFKLNKHYMRGHYGDFLEFFFSQMFPEPHSTKQVEDAVAYGLDGSADVMVMDEHDPVASNKDQVEAICHHVRRPVLVIHGDRDECQVLERGLLTAELTGGRMVKLEGKGHIPNARHPVLVNKLIADF